MDPIISQLVALGKLIALPAGKTIYDWIKDKNNPIALAAQRTQNEIEIPLVGVSLLGWIETAEFGEALMRLKAGQTISVDQLLVDSYCHVAIATGNAGELTPKAKTIVERFLSQLYEELLNSEKGLAFHSYRQEVLHATTHAKDDQIIATLAKISQDISKISAKENISSPSTGNSQIAVDATEIKYDAQLDIVKQLLQQDKFGTAFDQLIALQEEVISATVSDRIRFRIATGLASCAFERGDIPEAIRQYKIAYDFQPKNSIAIGNRAYAALLEGHIDEAEKYSDQALATSDSGMDADIIRLSIIDAKGPFEDVYAYAQRKPEMLETARTRSILGQMLMRREREAEAAIQFEEATKLEAKEWRNWLFLGTAILSPIQKKNQGKSLFAPSLTEPDTILVNSAIQALSQAIELLRHTELTRELAEAHSIRAAARLMIGSKEDAESDSRVAVNLDPKGFLSNLNSAIIALESKHYESAVTHFTAIPAEKYTRDMTIPYSLALLGANRFDDAFKLLSGAFSQSADSEEAVQLGFLLVEALSRLQEPDRLRLFLTEIDTSKIPEQYKIAIRVDVYEKLGDATLVEECLSSLLQFPCSEFSRAVGLHVARVLYGKGSYAHAANFLNQFVTLSDDISLIANLVVSLYNSGQIQQALKIAQTVRKGGDVIPVISEIEAMILQYSGRLSEAEVLFHQLYSTENHNRKHALSQLECLYRLGRTHEAQDLLRHLLTTLNIMEPRQLMDIAKLQIVLDVGDSLDTLYMGLKLGWEDAQVHLTYIGLMHSALEQSRRNLQAETVTIDSVVTIEERGQKFTIAIAGATGIAGPIDSVDSSSPIAKELLGKRSGDSVRIKSGERGAIQDRNISIESVQSKFVHAFQLIGATFETRFMDTPGLHRVDISDNDLSDFKLIVQKKHMFVVAMQQMHEIGRLPLGACAILSGDSIIAAWGGMVSLEKGTVLVANGTDSENQIVRQTIQETKRVVADLTAILSIVSTNSEDLVLSYFDEVLISQSVLDDITQEIANHKLFGKDVHMVVGMRNGEYVKYEVTQADREHQLDFYQRLASFCRNKKCTVAAAPPTATLPHNRYEDLCKAIGRSSVDSILLSKHLGVPLYCDDLALRLVCSSEFGDSRFVATPYLVDVLEEQGQIDKTSSYQLIQTLILSNYGYVRVKPEFLKWVLEENHYKLTQVVDKIFRRTLGIDCDGGAALTVASEVVKMIWLSGALVHSKAFLLDFICRLLLDRPNGVYLLRAFQNAVVEKFFLFQKPLQEIVPRIQYWQRQRLQ